MIAVYTGGTPVKEGDRLRYHQTPGGLLSPETDANGNIKWHYGTAVKFPGYQERRDEMLARIEREGWGVDPDELHCKKDNPGINNNDANPARTTGGLVDARRHLIRYQAGHGLRLTIDPWDRGNGVAYQAGDLMAGMDVIGQWAISYPLEDGAELPHGVERMPA